MGATINLDKAEITWYLQGAMSGSHLRWEAYERMVKEIWKQLSEREREWIYTYVKRDLSWHFDTNTFKHIDETPKRYFEQVLARYNPANQYLVTMNNGKLKKDVVEQAYKWDGRYYVGWRKYCAKEHIKKVEQLPYRKCKNDLCKSCNKCVRYTKYKDGDELMDKSLWICDKCDWIIEETSNK